MNYVVISVHMTDKEGYSHTFSAIVKSPRDANYLMDNYILPTHSTGMPSENLITRILKHYQVPDGYSFDGVDIMNNLPIFNL